MNYETQKMYPVKIDITTNSVAPLTGKTGMLDKDLYKVTQMKFASKTDKSTLHYNAFITLHDIPLEAYEYIVNGKSELDWIVERYCIKTDKDSGIENDANNWGLEVEDNAKYPLELFQRVITVSLETMKIVKSLPAV